nr:integrase, catalytic region, zinc finger, CCHC-type, peptidase aspartic, catalytic [Tanacetum cinerariifolium]
MQTQTSNTLHNAIMEAGSKDRPPMLAPGNYVQWKSRIKRYINTKPNHELFHYCLMNPLYELGWKEKFVLDSKGNPTTITERVFETYKNVTQDIRDQLYAEAEAVQIILTGMDNDIYSTVDACPNACEMWKAIKRLKQGESINVQDLETNLYWEYGKFTSQDGESLESYNSRFYKMMNELIRNQCKVTNHQVNVQFLLQLQPEWQRTRRLINFMALISLSFKKIYKPTNNNLRTSSNTSRANQDNSPRINKNVGYESQRCGNVAGARKTNKLIGKMILMINMMIKNWKHMAKIQEVSPDDVDFGPIFDTKPKQKEQNDDYYDVFAIECQHPEKSESVHKTYLIEQDAYNVIIESVDMNYDSEQIDQNDEDADLSNERELLASLIKKLKCEIDESKNHNKFLETSNKVLIDKLKSEIEDFKNKNKSLELSNNKFKEANNKLSEENDLLYADFKKSKAELKRRDSIEYASEMELECAKKEAQIKLYKTREDKEVEKVIELENKVKVLDNIVYKTGQSVQTMNMLNNKCRTSFAKPEFLKKAKEANPHLYDIGCYNDNLALMLAPESDEVIRLEKESRSKLSDLIKPFDYTKLNNLYDLFVPQQTTLLEKRMDESIPVNKNCQSFLEIVNIKMNINTIITGVELCKQKIANRTYFGHIDPFIQNMIEQKFCPVISKINAGLDLFLKRLNEEMVVDLRYFNSLEREVGSLTSQLETQKTQFVNEINRLSREYYYADHMNAILGVYTELDEVTNLQCDYLELLQKCECLETELSKSKMMSKSFESVQKHAINLELELQQCKEKIKNDMSFKVNKSKDFCKEHEQYIEIQDLKAQLQEKGIVISELKKLIEKQKGKYMDTKFEKASVIRQPNAFNSQRPSVLGKPTTFSNSFVRKDFSKSTSVTQTHVSNDFSKPITAQTLPSNMKSILKNMNVLAPGMYKLHTDHIRTRTSQLPQDSMKTNKHGDRVMHNYSQGKKKEVEDHRRSGKLSNNNTSVTACNDSLNAKTLNVKSVSAMCDKCVLIDKHVMCVLKYVAKPLKETVALESNNKPRNFTRKLYERLIEIVLFIVDSRCSKHMTRNLKLLINFLEKFLETVKFRNDQIAPILGYGDLVQGAIMIKRVYYVEGLNHNLFCIGQFYDADLEVAFRKSTCFIRDLKGNDLLTGSRGMDLYLITLQVTNSPNLICLMAKATLSQAWLWHRRLSHLNFDTINLLSKNDIVVGLPKLKFIKDHLCSSCLSKEDFMLKLEWLELIKVVSKSFAVTTPDESIQRQQQQTTSLVNYKTSKQSCQVQSHESTVTSNENINQAELNADEFINAFSTPVQDQGETSNCHVDSSNMHTFYQRYSSEHRWTKDHPLEQVIGNPSQSVRTRRQLESDAEMCMFTLTVSRTEPKNIKDAMANFAWIESMQEELHQFDRLEALYGLKQAPRAWYDELFEFLLSKGFSKGSTDPTLFITKHWEHIFLVQIYVDDIIFGSTNPNLSKRFEKLMHNKFEMSMMRKLKFFLGIQIHQSPCGIFINKAKYAQEILLKHGMTSCDGIGTPMATKHLDADLSGTPLEQMKYHSKVEALI